MQKIVFKAEIININNLHIIQIPILISQKLPSRGIVMVEGEIHRTSLKTVLEPDGKGSHIWKIEKDLLKKLDIHAGDEIIVELHESENWIEPEIPNDMGRALVNDKTANKIWNQITPLSRWDWIRWISSTNNPDTRRRRIEVACSKLASNKRRPCCFDKTKCTDVSISKNGVLHLLAS